MGELGRRHLEEQRRVRRSPSLAPDRLRDLDEVFAPEAAASNVPVPRGNVSAIGAVRKRPILSGKHRFFLYFT